MADPADLWSFSNSSVTASGDSGPLPTGTAVELAVDSTITTGGVTFYVDRQGSDGNWYSLWSSGAQATAGTVSASIGAGLTTTVSLGHTVRFRWVLSGSTAGFSVSLLTK
jgi:hypothetical protein